MSSGLLKVQRPLFDSIGNYSQILVYDKSRRFKAQFNVSRKIIEQLFPSGEFKAFWHAVYNIGSESVSWERIIPEKDWPNW